MYDNLNKVVKEREATGRRATRRGGKRVPIGIVTAMTI